MNDLRRTFAKAKLANTPLSHGTSTLWEDDQESKKAVGSPPWPEPVQDDDESSSASSTSTTGTIKPSPSKHLFAQTKGSAGTSSLDPLPWFDFFSQELYLQNPHSTYTITHHVYLTPPTDQGPLFVCHHGAGASGLSFALFASEIRKALPRAGILAIDARGHGATSIEPSNAEDLDFSLPTLSQELLDVIILVQEKLSEPRIPDMVLIGHSLGGPVVVELVKSGKLGDAVLGYAVLDVVEGSAVDALQKMQAYLSSRPSTFPSLSAGIEWHLRSRTLRFPLSAQISVPSILKRTSPPPTNTPATEPPTRPETPAQEVWTWRTNYPATQPFWEGWFSGLSNKFLTGRGGKLLLLAGTDRLDKELMIGQMQGKYQLQVFPDAGHFIQEDQPAKTAALLVNFYRRNDRAALVLPPKVGAGSPAGGGMGARDAVVS